MRRHLVLMSGYPGSGKSTLAGALSAELGWMLISKDALLAAIFDAMGLPTDETERAGKAAWAVFWQMARRAPAAVLDVNIRADSAFEREQLEALDASIVEVRCVVSPELAAARYAARAEHGHAAQRFRVLTPARLADYAEPLAIGQLVTVDTTIPVDTAVVADQVRRLFQS